MLVKIWQCFRATDGIGVEDGQRSAGEKEIDDIEETTMWVAGGGAPTAM
jgi:hypothetical protein